jgi:hypothetical protein
MRDFEKHQYRKQYPNAVKLYKEEKKNGKNIIKAYRLLKKHYSRA